MTYPQQPYGGQDPYNQGQQQQPQYGGYPQTGGQQYVGQQPYGGYDQNAQYGGYPQYGGGYGGPPPPRKNTGMIVAIVSIVVLLLAGIGITGFVAPGFFLSDDKKNDAGGGTGGTSSSPKEGSGADAFIDKLVAAADDKNAGELNDLACDDAEDGVQAAIDQIDEISGAELADTDEVSKSEVKATIDITVDGEKGQYEATVVEDGGDWCWKDASLSGGSLPSGENPPNPSTEPGGGGGGDSSPEEGQAYIETFVDKVNGGDAAGAKGMLCGDSTAQTDIDDAITGKAALEVDASAVQAQTEYVGIDLKGTINGEPLSASRTSAFYEDSGWCVFMFYVF
ncbi:MAG: hypothetical protein GEV28_09425 [Actinophytocola sp.]|uniref:hypothetical protein n=1 Tax=Actinophytocola sp. TaxID=1872138 RepID=UPI00132A8CB2|nr:hypothetical protein [Actinophytocola sp.]MPZ80595.1 hypothetical protein [Actinophytocola sp.]